MARPKYTARKPTGGKAPRKVLSSRGCCRGPHYQRHPPPVSDGPWVSVACGPRFHRGVKQHTIDKIFPYSDEQLIIPSHIAVSDVTLPQRNTYLGHLAPQKSQSDSPGSKLPTELLLQIFEPLISTGGVYHFTRAAKQKRGLENLCHVGISVFAVTSDPDLNDPEVRENTGHRALALTCRRFRDISYEIFYKRNEFVFEVAQKPLTCYIDVAHEVHRGPEYANEVVGWNRAIATPESVMPCPFGIDVSKHIASLTIAVVFTNRCPTIGEQSYLRDLMATVARNLGNQDHGSALRRLTLDVSVAEKMNRQWVSTRLSLVRVTQGAKALSTMRMKIENLPELNERSRGQAAAKFVISPLLELRGLEQIEFSGLLQDVVSAVAPVGVHVEMTM